MSQKCPNWSFNCEFFVNSLSPGQKHGKGRPPGNLLDETGLMISETPDAEGEEACKELGRKLAAW